MKHNIIVEGVNYRLRPVKLNDAQFIIDTRIKNKERNQYINSTSSDINLQKAWIEKYFEKEGDYYFIIENSITSEPEGTVGIYDIDSGRAEWGRWVLKEDSLSSIESVDLMFKVAFTKLNLDEVYCRTIVDNKTVVEFHNTIKQLKRGVVERAVRLGEKFYDVMEHYVNKNYYFDTLQTFLESKSYMVFRRNLRMLLGSDIIFHHIGVATDNIEKEFSMFRLLGYQREGLPFKDTIQGIKGLFIVHQNQPRLELLENLPNSTTLNKWLESNVKMYHFGYKVKNIEEAIRIFSNKRARIISPLKYSTYFNSRICFLVLANRFIVELIEEIDEK